MAEAPWLTIVGLGEDGPEGLVPASRAALDAAEVVMGPARHLALLPDTGAERIAWPVPFADGLPVLEALRGRRTVVLASGDPFWFGAGRAIAGRLARDEWRAVPGRSTFALAASVLGWPLEDTLCVGLHAAPLQRLRPHLAPGRRAIVLLRDGAMVSALATWMNDEGFGATVMTVLEALGGPRERVTVFRAEAVPSVEFHHPLAVALDIAGSGPIVPLACGREDAFFLNDGQITKRPVRALALSALAPLPGERLWDIGGGSGSISVEWCLLDRGMRATAIEARAERAARIRANASRYGLDGLEVVEGRAPEALEGLQAPNAVFVGGGLSDELLSCLETRLDPGTRIVAHAVTLESEALLADAAARLGGDLMRIELAQAAPLGRLRGWQPARPLVQWRVTL